MTNIIPANQIIPSIHIENDHAVVSSKTVAEHFGKSHKNVMRDIEKLECSEQYRELNFEPSFYTAKSGNGATRKYKCYNLTKDGFVFLAMGFTGKRAAHFKEAYIQAFNQMELSLSQPNIPDSSLLGLNQEQAGFLRTILRLSEKLERREKDTYLKIREMKKLLSMAKTLCTELESEVTTFEQQVVSDQNVISHIHLYRSLMLKGENSQVLRSFFNVPF